MAAEDRIKTGALDFEHLLENENDLHGFDFFHAVRCLENAYPEKPRVGHALHAKDDVVRLAQKVSLDFAPSTLASYTKGKRDDPGCLSVYFFGLLGPNGPLPTPYTEYAIEKEIHDKDKTFSRFLDIFNHRMLSFFYRAWADADPIVNLDRPDTDRFAEQLGSLFGMGLPSMCNRDAMPDLAKLHYAGRLACPSRDAEGLEAILNDYFKVPVRILEFVGQWLQIPQDQQSRVDSTYEATRLGVDFTLGERVWNRQSRFRILMGPLGREHYESLLPGTTGWRVIGDIVRNYVGMDFDWDIQLILDESAFVPEDGKESLFALGQTGALGWTTWLTNEMPSHDREHLALSIEVYDGCPIRMEQELTSEIEPEEVSA